MRWADVIPAVLAVLDADATLVQALGGKGVQERRDGHLASPPEVTWFRVSDVEDEVWNPLLLDFEVLARSPEELATIEGRLRHHLHRDVEVVIPAAPGAGGGSIRLFTQLEGARDLEHPEEGVRRTQLDFRLQAVRSKYLR